MKYIFYFIILHIIIATPQFNLYYTDLVSKTNNALQYNCLRIVTYTREENINNPRWNIYNREIDVIKYEIMSYCMNEFTSKYHIEENTNPFPKYNFSELSKQNILSEELYHWSAPIDLIENYQFYLNQLSKSKDLSNLEIKDFYNCTLPRFGPQCQFELDYHYSNHSSLYEIIHEIYTTNEYNPMTLTCYMHLQCYHGLYRVCLDWSDICNGKIDCPDGGFDEEHCWQLEINECQDNEYRCDNGQCIPKTFFRDTSSIRDCIDRSDESKISAPDKNSCNISEPTFECEDRICQNTLTTSSCVEKRQDLLMKAMFSIKDNSTSEDCWFAVKCLFNQLYSKESACLELYAKDSRLKNFFDSCPKMFYVPNYPILFGDTYIAIEKNFSKEIFQDNMINFYTCYNHHSHYDTYDDTMKTLFNNRTCIRDQIGFVFSEISKAVMERYYAFIYSRYDSMKKYHFPFNYISTICNKSTMYQCMNSFKCIRIQRLVNGRPNCPHSDDQNMSIIISTNPNIIEQLNKTHFYCQAKKTYLNQNLINDGACNCRDDTIRRCTDEYVGEIDSSIDILFPTICDGFQELFPIIIENKNETDETECEHWECDNIYTHCDGVWNCPNGVDEIYCDKLSRSQCSLNNYLCVSPSTYRFMCLNISKVNDGNIDCIGGTDEPIKITYLPQDSSLLMYRNVFSCVIKTSFGTILPFMICNYQWDDCEHGDDEKFCTTDVKVHGIHGICLGGNIDFASDVEKYICEFMSDKYKRRLTYFKLDNVPSSTKKVSDNVVFSSLSTIKISSEPKFRCHRGLNVRVWLNNENDLIRKNIVCLCPPSYYGDDCQYQNERISLAIQFRALSDSRQTLFAIIISLIDDSDDRVIHSYEQITYLSLRNCRTKYQMYLLYSTRPKNLTKNYSIHIDIYEKKSLIHRGSLLFPILFPFLPVYRFALLVDIPPASNINNQICSNRQCNHGKCIKYSSNSNNLTFCQCEEGWSGQFCTIKHTCICSSDSLCIGTTANNQSICVCPLNKYGFRCLLTVNKICENNNKTICENGGECISNDHDLIFNQGYTCICPIGYNGDRCEIVDNELSLSFDKDIILPQEIFIHFIQIIENGTHRRSTTFRTIPITEDLIRITWSKPFHIVFIELSNKIYYLTVVQNIYNQSAKQYQTIKSSDRCPHINELFNKTFLQWHFLRRIKYYHIPCQNQSLNLSCFYDDDIENNNYDHFCLCYQFGEKRLSNCFHFDHNMTFNCEGQNECENKGQCFQDYPDCRTRSWCKCPSCFFGQRCQLSTNGFGLSLDVILGYQILQHININQQPFIVKISLGLTIIFIITGIINGILSIITFKNKVILEVGCGLYLLSSSITTLLTTIMFGLKFFILLFSHMSIISNKSFLSVQCYLFDFILRICLSIDQWLNACIAIERTITVLQGASFNKKKSKKTAKLMIIIFSIIITVSCIHDPIHRKLIDEINYDNNRLNRIWCITSYSSNLEIYNSFIHTFHFIGPFIINLISSIILIVKKTRQLSNLHQQQPYKEILNKTIKENKQLLTAPVVLVTLGLPRIVLIFTSKCMKSANDAWLFLCGYFISFIPPMLTFLIFILPSTFYKKTFRTTITKFSSSILRWFGFIQ